MSKSYWMKEQGGNFSNKQKDTFDPEKRYVGIRLQQGVPLLDRDWNEFEDIRRYEELMLRKWYVGNGSPDNGFEISAVEPPANDFKIAAGRCIVDGFEAVNEPEVHLFSIDVSFEGDLNKEGIISEELKDEFKTKKDITLSDNTYVRKRKENKWVIADTEKFIVKKEEEELKIYEVAKYVLYKQHSQRYDLADLTVPTDEDTDDSGWREDTVYLDVWIEERKSGEGEYDAPDNSQDVNVPTCVRHRLEWRVRVDEGRERHEKEDCHHYYDLAEIRWENKEIIEVKDLRTTKLTLTSVKNELEDVRKATANRWINGGEMNDVSFTNGKCTFSISEMLCIIGGQEINFDLTESKEIKVGENCAVVARATDETTEPEIEFIVTRKNLLEWLNSWSLEKWRPAEDTEPVLKSTFTLPLYFFETVGADDDEFKKTDLRHQGVLDTWLTELAGRLDSRERRMCGVPLLQQTILGWAVPVATVAVGGSPNGVAFDGAYLWVTNSPGNKVSKIDITTNEVKKTLYDEKIPYGVAFDGVNIWVANSGDGINIVSKIDITKDNVIKNVDVGKDPRGVAFDGVNIWVAHSSDNRYKGSVSKIDITEDKVLETVTVGKDPRGVAFDGVNIWVAHSSDNSDKGSVSKIDITEDKVLETVTVGKDPRGVAFDGVNIWVAHSSDNSDKGSVSKIDITEDKVIATVLVGEDPYGVAFDGVHIWVANYGSDNVSKIDITTNKVIATVIVGNQPRGVAFDGAHIWVANHLGNSVSKILRGDLK